jgi:hypothetical protein
MINEGCIPSGDNPHLSSRHNRGMIYLCLLDCATEQYGRRATGQYEVHPYKKTIFVIFS